MKKRLAKKIMRYLLVVTVVDNIDHKKELGVAIFSPYSDDKALRAMKKFPQHEEVIRWNNSVRYKESV